MTTLSAVLISGFKEQQVMIETQQRQMTSQQLVIEKLNRRLAALEKSSDEKGSNSFWSIAMKLTSTVFSVVFATFVANSTLA